MVTSYKPRELGNMLSTFPEVEHLDVPGVDYFTEFHGIYFTFQPNIHAIIPGDGRWVLTDNPSNPKAANQAYYPDAYYRIDQAIEHFKTEVLNERK